MRRILLMAGVAFVLFVPSWRGVAAQRGAGMVTAMPVVAPAVAVPRTALPLPEQGGPDAALAAERAARVDAFEEARRLGLSYLPGEVLVKFRRGTNTAGQQRALTAVRSRTPAGQLRWMGEVARLVDRSMPYADQTAALLALQPEVEFAQP